MRLVIPVVLLLMLRSSAPMEDREREQYRTRILARLPEVCPLLNQKLVKRQYRVGTAGLAPREIY